MGKGRTILHNTEGKVDWIPPKSEGAARRIAWPQKSHIKLISCDVVTALLCFVNEEVNLLAMSLAQPQDWRAFRFSFVAVVGLMKTRHAFHYFVSQYIVTFYVKAKAFY